MRQQSLVSLKRRATNPNYIAGRTRDRSVRRTPHAMPSGGTEESLNAITQQDLLDAVKDRFARESTDHRGDRRYYTGGTWPSARPSLRNTARTRRHGDNSRKSSPSSGRNLCRRPGCTAKRDPVRPTRLLRDDPHWYTGLVMNYILGGGGFSSRLYSEVREKRGLAYSVGAGLNPMRLTALIAGSAGTNNENVAESLKIIQYEWRRMRDEGVTEDELSQAKSFLTGSFHFASARPTASRACWCRSSTIILASTISTDVQAISRR